MALREWPASREAGWFVRCGAPVSSILSLPERNRSGCPDRDLPVRSALAVDPGAILEEGFVMLVVASIRPALLNLGIAACVGAGLMVSSAAQAAYSVKVNNQTGHNVNGFLFTDGKIHTSGEGGIPIGKLSDGGSTVVELPSCNYQILLVDGTENWHVEYKDCEAKNITVYSESGRGQPKKP